MLNKRIKIAIAVQQCESFLDATRSDQRIYGLPNRYPEGPEFSEVPRRLNRDVFTDERDQRDRSPRRWYRPESSVRSHCIQVTPPRKLAAKPADFLLFA